MSEDYSITLDLDDAGRITGGSYSDDQWDRGDFAWYVNITAFTGYFKLVSTIYQASTGDLRAAPEGLLRAPRPLPAERPHWGHTPMFEASGSIVVPPYTGPVRYSWSLQAPVSYLLTFENLSIEQPLDLIRVYEGADGDGPLVAALSGSHVARQALVRGPAYVSFVAHPMTRGGDGFTMHYKPIA